MNALTVGSDTRRTASTSVSAGSGELMLSSAYTDRHVVGIRDPLETMPLADQNLAEGPSPAAVQSPHPVTNDLSW